MKTLILSIFLWSGFGFYLNANEINILSVDEGSSPKEILLKGKNEYCLLSINTLGVVIKTDCIRLENSKKIKIICTQDKELCKTEKEIFDYVKMKPVTTDKKYINGLRQLMRYSDARKILLDSGWQAVNTRWKDIPELGFVHDLYFENGWKEVKDCSGFGMAPCSFEFKDANQRRLVIITIGECLVDENQSSEKNKKCDLSVDRWFLNN